MAAIVKKLHQGMKRLLNKKGQGLVEFALILAFCVGVGLAARDAGLLDSFSDSFNQGVLAYLNIGVDESTSSGNGNSGGGSGSGSGSGSGDGNGGGGNGNSGSSSNGNSGSSSNGNSSNDNSDNSVNTNNYGAGIDPNGTNWRQVDPNTYYKTVDSENRLLADQKALENIAKHFIGKTQEQVIALIGTAADISTNPDVTLGHFIPIGNNQGMRFATDKLKAAEGQNIFAWMQGIQETSSEGEKDNYKAVKNENYDSSCMYLVSDYVVSQAWADTAGGNQKNGLKIKLEYNYSGYDYGGKVNTVLTKAEDVVVVGAHITIDPRSQDNETNEVVAQGLSNVGDYNGMSSKGLDIQVRMNRDGSLYVTQVDTGKAYRFVEEKDKDGNVTIKLQVMDYNENGELVKGSGGPTYMWYGNGDAKLVNTYIKSIAKTGEKGFEPGDILKWNNIYYVATKKVEEVVNTTTYNNAEKLEKQYGFVKISGSPSNTGNYWHENMFRNNSTDGTVFTGNSYTNRRYGEIRGVPVTLDTGEIYVYIGPNNWEYTGIDDTNFIKIRESTMEPWSLEP